ncbi:hypothetical protein ILUMI_24248 [Ignelater luminosus]|uniref:Acyltransferase 3 domain-containing protein n=1 Tax=Ignelater luminosus TaxID=2038154 RepID=A0A8K0C7E3_IGNLU|nr:hypothetical protein ILUMI_24248 [Ignelater luminosus]
MQDRNTNLDSKLGCILTVSKYYLFHFSESAHPLLIAFSVITNGRKLFTISRDTRQISCLHGIRVLSTVWVIIGHRYQTQLSFPVKNMLYLKEWMDGEWSMFIKGGTLSVDTFFLLSGLTISYVYMQAAVKKVKFNILLFYLHRYLRLTPLLAVVVISYITILQHLGSGPLWPNAIRGMQSGCKENWWKALLYIQNFGNLEMCISQSWYLSVDTQLYILSPILLIPLLKWPGIVLSLTGLLGICSILSCFLTTWFFEFNLSMGGNTDPEALTDYMRYYYFATYTRSAPWLIGILLGYILFQVKFKGRIVINKVLVSLLWIASFAILITCLYAGYTLNSREYNKISVASHLAFERPIWAVAVGWIIFACVTGYGDPVNWFLSLPVFQVVSKFTYALYLVHLAVIYITTAQMRTVPFVSDAREMYIFWGDFALTFAVSVVVTLAFESPIIIIEKWLLDPRQKKASAIEVDRKSNEA